MSCRSTRSRFSRRSRFEAAPGSLVPIIGVRPDAFLAMQIGVNRHGVLGLQIVYQVVSTVPIALGIPPKRHE